MALKINRRKYASLYGPTTGDRVRLADTEIIIEVEKDFTVYGEEIKFGGGKVIRDGMAQDPDKDQGGHFRSGDHQCPISDWWAYQGRRRYTRRQDCGHRQGRQSQCTGRHQ